MTAASRHVPTLTFGAGEFSCAVCGLGMEKPCGHWKQMNVLPIAPIEEELVAVLAKQLHHHLSAAQNLAWEEGDTCGDCKDDVRDICMPIIRAYVADHVREAERNGRWIQHQVHCPYCNQGARGCDIGRGLEAKR